MSSPGEKESERRAFVAAAGDKLKQKYVPRTNPADRVIVDLQNLIDHVLSLSRPIQQAGGAIKSDDIMALRHHVFSWTLEGFDPWDKERLAILATTLIAERIMKQINSDPWAHGTPEGLSGV